MCTVVHQPVPVARRLLRTGDYPEEARARLGAAVEQARIAAGHLTRPEFAEKAGVGLRSLIYLEQANRSVGAKVLYPVAIALPGWSESTPRDILEGGDPPTVDVDTMAKERVRAEVVRRLANVKKHFPVEYQLLMETVRSGEVTDAEVDRAITEL